MIKGKMFDLINNVRDSFDEDGYDNLMDLMKPDEFSKEIMESKYEETLGYNPLTYFDSESLKRVYDNISKLPFITDNVKEKFKTNLESDKVKMELDYANSEKDEALATSVILNFCLDESCMDHEFTEEETDKVIDVLEKEFDLDKERFVINLVRNYEIVDTALSKESSMANNIHKKAARYAEKSRKFLNKLKEAENIISEEV